MKKADKPDYSPLDNAILAAIKSGISQFREIDAAVSLVAKPYRPYTGQYDEWPTAHVVRRRLAYLSQCQVIKSTKGIGWEAVNQVNEK